MDKKYETLIFDLDGTLAESKSPLKDDMARTLTEASKTKNIVIITGGMFEQIKLQVIDRLLDTAFLQRVYVLPTSGSAMRHYKNGMWEVVYEHNFTHDQKNLITEAITKGLKEVSFSIAQDELYGVQIEDRGSQVSYSALGQQAPYEKKKVWDPDKKKRRELVNVISPYLGEGFDVKYGGSTTIDITKDGIDKAYGIKEFFIQTELSMEKAIFVGDEIEPGGNDYAAVRTGIDTYQTSGPNETMELIKKILHSE